MHALGERIAAGIERRRRGAEIGGEILVIVCAVGERDAREDGIVDHRRLDVHRHQQAVGNVG
jgi:hypothetical protein